jgi:2-amino-4-hydroxy-6-hydroxymethyldihydropteridine diphosphokinase
MLSPRQNNCCDSIVYFAASIIITSKEQESEMAIAYVALGSNLGDKKKNLQRALILLMQQGVEVLQVSGYFATEPYGVTDQPQFLNAVCRVRTNLEPVALLRTLLATELAMGRVRLRHWGERNIDLDLLLYENVVMQTSELTLPHPDMQNRDFVLLPLLDIAPELVHPLLHKTVREMAAELNK